MTPKTFVFFKMRRRIVLKIDESIEINISKKSRSTILVKERPNFSLIFQFPLLVIAFMISFTLGRYTWSHSRSRFRGSNCHVVFLRNSWHTADLLCFRAWSRYSYLCNKQQNWSWKQSRAGTCPNRYGSNSPFYLW